MIYFEVTSETDRVVLGNIQDSPESFAWRSEKTFTRRVKGQGVRGLFENCEGVGIWVVVKDEPDLLESSKMFRRLFELYKSTGIRLCRMQREQVEAYRHVLSTIHAKMDQKIDGFTDGDRTIFFSDSHRQAKEAIQKFVLAHPYNTADLLCYQNKMVIDLGAHILGVDIVHFGRNYMTDLVSVRIKAAILNQYASFAQDFERNYLVLRVNHINETSTVLVDRNMFSLIMYNIFSNAVKYCKMYSEIRFHFNNDTKELDISMISLKIEPYEIESITRDRIRGENVGAIPGSGVGLFVIKSALELMGKNPMRIIPEYSKTELCDGVRYVKNHFIFNLA